MPLSKFPQYIIVLKSAILVLLLFAFHISVNAQKLTFESFAMDPTDLTARTKPVNDYNDVPCALVKIGLVVPGTTFRGNIVETKKQTSEYWVYFTDGAENIEIQAPGYQTFNFDFPEPLKKSTTYRLVLNVPQSAAAQPQQPTQKTGFLVITATPKESDVYVNGEFLGSEPQPKRFAIGTTVSYKVSCDLYHDAEGTVEIDRMQTPLNVSLKPAFGSVKVTSQPSGAKAMLDGKSVGTTPLTLQKIASGNHTVKVQTEKYAPAEKRILVSDNQQTDASFSLEARFADITIHSLQGATIKIDGVTKGTSSINEQLMEGLYEVEALLDGHKTAKQQVTVKAGHPQTITLNPVPQYGTLVVESNPFGADIYIGGKKIGTTPYVSDNLLIGSYDVVLRKQGYADFKTTARVQENQESTVNATMKKGFSEGEVMVVEVNGVSFKMVPVEGGTFTMGATSEQGSAADSDESPTHSVTLSSYYIGQTEVTQELWQAVMGSNPSNSKGSKKPVEEVSWNDCQTFITKLNSLTGKKFSLPTEAQWEYAARGGNKSKGYKYSGSNTIGDVAWYDGNSNRQTHTVGTNTPNELGIYDMSGNVVEWCQDWYDDYSSSAQTNPTGPSSGPFRVRRGGSWYTYARTCRVSIRKFSSPDNRHDDLGLRLVLVP